MSRKYGKWPATQVQCPNCGGFDVWLEGGWLVDPQDTSTVVSRGPKRWEAGDIIVLVFVGSMTFGVGALFWWIFMTSPTQEMRHDRWLDNTANLRAYRCRLCSNEWQQLRGGAPPKVTIRPDLIAKGEARLRAEQQRGIPPSELFDE